MAFIRSHIGLLLSAFAFIGLMGYGIFSDTWWIYLIPYALLTLYVATVYTEFTFFFILAATPVSVNIEEYVDGFGLFLPTEPLLFGTMLLLLLQSLKGRVFPKYIWHSPLVWSVILYLVWLFFSSIVSSSPIVSFKFLLAKLWFIVPVLFYGANVFEDPKKIRWFLWLFLSTMMVAMLYTLIHHASFRFGEKEGHWVMFPFFKDHTIYGALVALIVPMLFALYFSRVHTPLVQFILLGFIVVNLLALYFSYTRAAWLSIILALGIWALIHFKVRLSFLLGTVTIVAVTIYFSWNAIQQTLERNKYEHTTEEFGERLQSATNVTTDASNLERLNRWSCAIAMFQERPLTGFGPGTYAFEYARFQEPENLTIISTNFGNMGNAHSEYLGPLAETGWPGLTLFLASIIFMFYQGIRVYHSFPAEDKELKRLVLGMILALSTYFIHGLLNNYLDTDKAAVPIWTMCAIFIAMEERLRKKGIPLVRVVR